MRSNFYFILMVLHIILTKVREQGKGIFKKFFYLLYTEKKKTSKKIFLQHTVPNRTFVWIVTTVQQYFCIT